MKKTFLLLIILFLVIGYYSCERDDICPGSASTTPSLIIDVFDFNSQENKKNIFGLLIAGVGRQDILPGYGIVSSNRLVLPLNTKDSETQYSLIKDAVLNEDGTLLSGNEDVITINYSVTPIFVSKACGYKYIFENVTIQLDETDTDPWILSRASINPNQSVEDETTTHFNIFH